MTALFFTGEIGESYAQTRKILVLGDSLVAGYGLKLEEAFPARLESRLKQDGYDVSVINAGVSGDTTGGGLTRLDWTLQHNPDYAIIVLGANDMLRNIDRKITQNNLEKILTRLTEKRIPVLLTGMKSFRNMHVKDIFSNSFQDMYADLADKHGADFYPFFLEGVAMDATLNLEDGIHPNPRGVEVIVNNIYDDVKKLLKKKG